MKRERLLLALVIAACASCGGKKTTGDAGTDVEDDGTPPVLEWDEEDLPYRVMVTVNPHPDRDRTDLPVLAPIEHPGAFVRRDVRIHEIVGTDTTSVQGGAWSQPDGTYVEAGFTATGTTPVGGTRAFLVYYDVSDAAEPWSWSDEGWASFAMVDRDGNGTDDGFRISGGGYDLERELNESDGTIRHGRRTGEATGIERGARRWAEGFRTEYQLETHTETYATSRAESDPPDGIVSHGDGTSAAAGASWSPRSAPVEHDLQLSYRVFEQWPFLQMVLSAAPDTFTFSGADWNGRTIYLTDAYDRMWSDNRGDEPIDPTWDTGMRWHVLYDSGSDRGFGLFIDHEGVIRGGEDGGYYIHDSYGGSAGGGTVFRYLVMVSDDKDEVADLFDAMKPGVTVSDAENRDLNIVAPRDGDHLFPDDVLEVIVSTPGSREPVTASIRMADGTTMDVDLDDDGSPLLWRSTDPLLLTASHPEGDWVLTAMSAGRTEEVTFTFRLPQHPRLMFGPEDLDGIRARKDDAAYEAIWNEMLYMASRYDDPIPDPGPGRDIRGYADTLMNLALIQLVDPSQPYEDLMWTYFFAMLRYPNWRDAENPFNNEDLTVGHFLTALALVYDWHYDALTPAERSEVRDHLETITDAWMLTSYMRVYRDITWPYFGRVTNNHYWINQQGVAAAAFVLEGEIPEETRSVWVDRLEENLAVILSVLEADGTSNEGVAYHSYGQINLFRWLDFRDRALGGNTAEAIPWFEQSVLWDTYSIMPGGDDDYGGPANFGDCPTRHYQPPRTIQAWLASRLGSGHAQWIAENLSWPRITAMSYLWYDPSVAAVAPDTLPVSRLFPEKGIFAWRSSWSDDATYLSLKSGSYFGGHEQPDAGHFVLHRAGVPYLTDHGYSYLKMTDEHSLVVIDGVGQSGEGAQWMSAVDPVSWAGVPFSLAQGSYFDVVADPTPMYLSEELTSWTREIVGLGPDVFLVRDVLTASASVDIDWLLHSYASEPPGSASQTYSYAEVRTENVWTEEAAGLWSILPQDGVAVLHVMDASASSWTAAIEPSMYVPEQNPDTREYNRTFDSFQVGHRLRRSVSADAAGSLVALWFGDVIDAESWSDTVADGVRLFDTAGDVALLVWPASASITGFHGCDVSGAMAGRWFDEPAYFGRGLTRFAQGGDVLVTASTPVSLIARLEHTGARFALVRAAASSDVALFCPVEPTRVTVDGTDASFTWAASAISLTLEAGEHRIEVE